MTKKQLKEHIDRYRKVEETITELDDKYGIQVWNARTSNFYNEYNYLIHELLVDIFGEEGTALIEDYEFEQTTMTFDELCDFLGVKE